MPFVPNPAQSIAGEIAVVQDAIFVPSVTRRTWIVQGGVFDAAGDAVPLADCWHSANYRASARPSLPPDLGSLPRLSGRHLFGGVYQPHFGHFLVESTARLWALDHLADPVDSILMLASRGVDPDRFRQDMARFLALVGLDVPVILADAPLRVETLVVPKQGMGSLDLMQGSPEYRTFIARRFARGVAAEGPPRIYVSRTRLGGQRGSLVGEEVLEDHLRAEGFAVLHPQEHPLEVQIARYKAAEVILGVDGSPFHLMAYVAQPDQRFVLFQRRPSREAYLQADQLRLFGAGRAQVIPAERTGWSPAGVRAARLSVYGVTRFSTAWAALRAEGLVSSGEPWPDLDGDGIRAAVRAIGTEIGADMCEVSSPGTSLRGLPRRSTAGRIRVLSERRWRRGLGDAPVLTSSGGSPAEAGP